MNPKPEIPSPPQANPPPPTGEQGTTRPDDPQPRPSHLASEVREFRQRGESAPVGAVLSQHPELRATKSLVLDLAYEEFCQRLEAGEKLDPDDFIARFPSYKTSVRKLLETHRFFDDKPHLLGHPGPVSWPETGDFFGGFSLLEELGRGAFARVYLAAEPALGNRLVAIKVSLQGTAEAETLGRLHHRNIVPVHSAQRDEKTGLNVVCMPFLGSATLCDVLDHLYARKSPPQRAKAILDGIRSADISGYPPIDPQPPVWVFRQGTYVDGVLHIGLQLAEALEFIHGQGICHRDLKPSNVLLTPDGRPMLLDFNLSFDEQVIRFQVGGTFPYMAPEHLRVMDPKNPGDPTLVDARSDLFSLGVILYELLTVQHPFGPSSMKLTLEELRQYLLQRQLEGARPITKENPHLDKAVARLIDRCLSSDPKNRPQSAAEMVAALRKALSPWRRARRWSVLHARLLLATVLVGMMVAGAGAYWVIPKEPYSVRQFHKGLEAYRQGRFDRALESLNEAIRADPENADAYFARGRAFQRLDQIESAIAAYTKAYQLKPEAKTAACLAYCLSLARFHEIAIAYGDLAIDSGLSNAQILNNRGYSYLKLRTLAKAENDFDQAERLGTPLQAVLTNRANLELQKACFHIDEKASIRRGLAYFQKAIAVGPETADLNFRAGQLCAHASIEDKTFVDPALDYWQKAIELGYDAKVIEEVAAAFPALRAHPRLIILKKFPSTTSSYRPAQCLLDPVED